MAARGHVQDPNDRRLRPIYGTVRAVLSLPGPARRVVPRRRPAELTGPVGLRRAASGPGVCR